jgi:hypothetical protein
VKKPTLPLIAKASWAPELVWTKWRRTRNSGPHCHPLVAIINVICVLCVQLFGQLKEEAQNKFSKGDILEKIAGCTIEVKLQSVEMRLSTYTGI